MPAASAARTSALVGLTALLPWSVFSRPRARPDSTNGNAENVGVPTHAPESQPPNPMPEPRTRRGIMPLKPRPNTLSRARVTGYRGSGTPYGLASQVWQLCCLVGFLATQSEAQRTSPASSPSSSPLGGGDLFDP